jgi:hypothetical protein
MEIGHLKTVLKKVWCADTSYNNEWDVNTPSKGQCTVTALVVQEFFGGKILYCKTAEGSTHYWNKLHSGVIDLTLEQFQYSKDYPLYHTTKTKSRNSLLKIKNVNERYQILYKKVMEKCH